MVPPVVGCLEAEDLSSLYDMVAHSRTLPADVLADIAAALARVAQDAESASMLYTSPAAAALASLVQEHLESIALPALEAVYSLAQHRDARHFIERHGLIKVVRDRLEAAPANHTARREELSGLHRLQAFGLS